MIHWAAAFAKRSSKNLWTEVCSIAGPTRSALYATSLVNHVLLAITSLPGHLQPSRILSKAVVRLAADGNRQRQILLKKKIRKKKMDDSIRTHNPCGLYANFARAVDRAGRQGPRLGWSTGCSTRASRQGGRQSRSTGLVDRAVDRAGRQGGRQSAIGQVDRARSTGSSKNG